MSSKKYFIALIMAVGSLFLLPASVVLLVDPFFILHKPYIFQNRGFEGPDRYLNAGLINTWLGDDKKNINTILIGTSMSQQFPVSAVKNEKNVSPLKLTIAGGTAKELSLIVETALTTGNVEHVIWEIYSSYMASDTQYLHGESPLPEYLYSSNVADQWKYLFNSDAVERAFKTFLGRQGEYEDVNDVYILNHEEKGLKYNSVKNTAILKSNLAEKYKPLNLSSLESQFEYPSVSQNLINILEQYPSVRFSIYFPPVSYYNYARSGDGPFWKRMNMIDYVLSETQEMDNVNVYGFDLSPHIGNDISNYVDASHYSDDICKKILLDIQNDRNSIQLAGHDQYTKSLAKRVNKFAQEFLK